MPLAVPSRSDLAVVGAYGKMPCLGDFFRIRLPRSFCAPWDQWLQNVLSSNRAALGDRWEGCYMSAPIWRFTLAPGLAGPDAVAGVLMPSVDKVGRSFPLTLARVGAGGMPDVGALEDIALAALEDDMTKDRLDQMLGALAPSNAPATPTRGAEWCAVLANQTMRFTTSALPTGQNALRLFDLDATPVRA